MPAGSGPLPLRGPGGLWTGCQNPREHPAVSQTSVGARRPLGGGWPGLTCPGPLGLLQQNTIHQAACGRKRLFLRLEVGVPGAADPGSGEGLTLGLPAVHSHARWCLSRNKGTNRGHEGLILMTSPAPHLPGLDPRPGDAGSTT